MGECLEMDVVIVGAGTAGLSALDQVLRVTERVLVVNDTPYGTTCAWAGCMPAKVLIGAANNLSDMQPASQAMLKRSTPADADRARVLAEVRAVRSRFVGEVSAYVEEHGRFHRRGHAHFLEPNLLQLGEERVRARKVILATGSRPDVPEEWKSLGARLVTTDALFELDTLPPRMAVAGLGTIGAGLAQALGRLGIAVLGVEPRPSLGGLTDPKVNAHLVRHLREDLEVELGFFPEISLTSEGLVRVVTPTSSREVDLLLVALERRPNLENLGLERLGLEPGGKNWRVDPDTLRLNDLPIYVAGDATGFRTLLHEAADDGTIAGRNAVSTTDVRYRRRVPMRIAFTSPEAATVGKPFEELTDPLIGERDFESLPRAVANAINKGVLRVYADPVQGRLLGAEMVAPGAEHLAHLLALAIDRELTVRDALGLPFYHPTLEEGLAEALRCIAETLEGRKVEPGDFLRLCQDAREAPRH